MRRRSDQAGCQLQGFERGSDCSPERAAGDTPPPGLRAQIPLLQEVSGLAAKSSRDGAQIQSPLRNRLRVWRHPPLGARTKGNKERNRPAFLPFGRRLYGQNQEPRENRANRNCYLSGTEQAGHAASHICVGSTHVSALSFLSLLVRICTPGPGHNRVRRFTFNDDHGQRQRVG